MIYDKLSGIRRCKGLHPNPDIALDYMGDHLADSERVAVSHVSGPETCHKVLNDEYPEAAAGFRLQ